VCPESLKFRTVTLACAISFFNLLASSLLGIRLSSPLLTHQAHAKKPDLRPQDPLSAGLGSPRLSPPVSHHAKQQG